MMTKFSRSFLASIGLIAILFALTFRPFSSSHIRNKTGAPYATNTFMDLSNSKQQTSMAGLDKGPFVAPLRTEGRFIVNAHGQRFKLASVSWHGANDEKFIAGGLNFRHRRDIAASIRKMGFNSVRFPYSDQMVIENPLIPKELISANLDLLDIYNETQGPRALDVYNACVEAMTDAGLAVIPNDHTTNAKWCDGMDLCDSSWKNDHYGPICPVWQSTDTWIENWKTVMRPFINNPLVIGADLRNEPRGIWGTMWWNMVATASEKASEALLEMNPNWLMFVEGVSSSNDISGARSRPIKLSIPNRVVYSSHVYKWSGWGSFSQYGKRKYPSFAKDMEYNWGYLLREDIAPVWVGEFGTPAKGQKENQNYWDNLMTYLQDTDADFGYWALNPRRAKNNQNCTYGLLEDDWETVVEDFRLADMRKLMIC